MYSVLTRTTIAWKLTVSPAPCLPVAAAVARDRVANVLLAYKGKNHLGGAARAAEDIARQTARELLGPLLDAACSRLAYVLRKALDIAADKSMKQGGLMLWLTKTG